MSEEFFPEQDWLKVGSGEKTGFMANFPIPGTHITMSYDAGDTFWNLSDEDKAKQAVRDAMKELGGRFEEGIRQQR